MLGTCTATINVNYVKHVSITALPRAVRKPHIFSPNTFALSLSRGVAIWSVGGGGQIGRESLSSFTEPKGISERSELIRGESVSEGNHPVARGIIQQPWAMGGHSAPASRES